MEQSRIEDNDYNEINTSEHSETSTNSIQSSYCSICLETEEVDKRYIKFPCQHIFHVGCFEQYLDYNISKKPSNSSIDCPVCREAFSTTTLKSVFDVCHENPNEDITVLIHNSNNSTTAETNPSPVRGCKPADVFVILLLLLGLTLYLLALYKRI